MITALDTAPFVATALGVGGVGVGLSRKRELILRWCVWAAAAPLVGGALLLGAPGAAALATALGLVCESSMDCRARLPRLDVLVLSARWSSFLVVAAPRRERWYG
jgi:phosphatidate cytidylyltransferase